MSKRPGTVEVLTEVGYCPFCSRTRNLRREQHRLGGLVRVIVSCETCHRTLSSAMETAAMQAEAAEEIAAPEAAAEPEPAPAGEPTGDATTSTKAGSRKTATAKKKGSNQAKPAAATARRSNPAEKPSVRKTASGSTAKRTSRGN